MNENYEKYIKDLPEEFQEKARQCKTFEELNEFIADNDLEIPDEALEMVAGGCGGSQSNTIRYLEFYYNDGWNPENKIDGAMVVEACKLDKYGSIVFHIWTQGAGLGNKYVVDEAEYKRVISIPGMVRHPENEN